MAFRFSWRFCRISKDHLVPRRVLVDWNSPTSMALATDNRRHSQDVRTSTGAYQREVTNLFSRIDSMLDRHVSLDNYIALLEEEEEEEEVRQAKSVMRVHVIPTNLLWRWGKDSSYWPSSWEWFECTWWKSLLTLLIPSERQYRCIVWVFWILSEYVPWHVRLFEIESTIIVIVCVCFIRMKGILRVLFVWHAMAKDFFCIRSFLFGAWSSSVGMVRLKSSCLTLLDKATWTSSFYFSCDCDRRLTRTVKIDDRRNGRSADIVCDLDCCLDVPLWWTSSWW